MFEAPKSKYLVPYDGQFRVADAPTDPGRGKWRGRRRLIAAIEKLDGLQKALYAQDRYAVLLVFQAMDAGGKDSTIRAVMQGINPAGCQVFSFKKPTRRDLDHDFLWRTYCSLPERGRIGIFNRSHYEEVLVVKVHPEILATQRLPDSLDLDTIWQQRFKSIQDLEEHLARNGTVIVKFWLNVSKEEQKARFMSRLNVPEKQWKFNAGDVNERKFWDRYMDAYEEALNATSRPWAPWYAVPADNKRYARACVAEIVVEALDSIGLEYPRPTAEDRATFDSAREELSKKW
jgi:PPK2 family polyphosphate:nucleotide phosphotransferase